eukprot:869151-Amphidinium_carterae.1
MDGVGPAQHRYERSVPHKEFRIVPNNRPKIHLQISKAKCLDIFWIICAWLDDCSNTVATEMLTIAIPKKYKFKL